MSVVNINGNDETQGDGTTLGDLIRSYPNCWLQRTTDGVAFRNSSHVLVSGTHYTLCFPAQPAGKPPKSNSFNHINYIN